MVLNAPLAMLKSWKSRSSHRRSPVKKCALKYFSKFHKKPPVLDYLYQKKTSIQVFSSEVCKIFKNINFEEHLQTIASRNSLFSQRF